MNVLRRRIRSVLAILLTFTLIARGGDSAEDLISRLQKKYDSIRDASVTFTQNTVFGVTHAEQTLTGRLLMKKGNKYRIETESQTTVTDGKSVWSYARVNNQVLIDTYKDDPRSFSPDKILVNVPNNYTSIVLGKEKIEGKETTIVKLTPKSVKSNLKWMKVWVDTDDWLMIKVQIFDISDNLTSYTISGTKLNTGIADSQFQFEVPRDVEVIDLR